MRNPDRLPRPGHPTLAGLACLLALLSANPAPAGPPEKTTFALTVTEAGTGRPLEGVAVNARADRQSVKGRTDARGVCSVELPAASPSFLGIWAEKDGFVPVLLEWRGEGDKPVAIPAEHALALDKGTTIGGLVRDEKGNPIAGATVFVLVPSNDAREPGRPRPNLWDREARTDAEGRWRCDVVPAKLDDVWLRLAHPDYASDTMYGTTPKPSLEKLRDGSGVMVLKKGSTVSGRVVAADGTPVAGAKVAQGADRFGSHYPEAVTDKDGAYRFANCRPGEMILTVQARGLAPDLRKLSVAAAPVTADFTLEPALRIAGRVVDPQGQPVAGAFVAADTWRGYRSLRFRVDTDQDGRFTWDDAPADEILFDMGKEGFLSVRHKALKAGPEATVVTMTRPLRVRGAVVDADTGQPVDAFSVLPGIDWGNGQKPSWERQEARRGAGGRFEYEFDYPRDGHLIRIEADGYLPAVSRPFRDGEGEVTFDARLRKGAGLAGTVLGPDGRPAVGASVCLLTPGSGVALANGRPPDRRNSPVAETDGEGRFRFPAQEGKFALVALHDAGFARRTAAAFAGSPEIRLEAWGRVEGTVRVGKDPAPGEPMRLMVDPAGGDGELQPYHDFRTTADANGHYAFDRVPPGPVQIAREIKLSERSTGYSHTTPATAAPGQVARADVGGTGRPIVGRVIAPGGAKVDWAYAMNGLRAAMPKLDLPEGLNPLARAARQLAWSSSPEMKAYRERSRRNYTVKVEPDGSFRVEDIPAGAYTLSLQAYEPLAGNQCGLGELIGSANLDFAVPEMTGGRTDEPLDVGTIELTLNRTVKVGDAAPDFEVPSLGGGTIRLEEYRGKFVVLDFWATWCGPCVAETPHLKAAYDAGSGDARFAMIGLSLDQGQDAPRKYAEKNKLGWAQGFLGQSPESKVAAGYGVQGIPSIWLIGPDGKVVAKDLRGDAIKAAVTRALAGAK